MSKSENPRGNTSRVAPILRAKHVRFIGECAANAYNAAETREMIEKEFGVAITYDGVKYYYNILKRLGAKLEDYLKTNADYSELTIESAINALDGIKNKVRLSALFVGYFTEKQKIAEDPSYNVAYADKRRRMLKVDQNIRELDQQKTRQLGSYPTAKYDDGSMDFKEFEIKEKDHAEQRKHLQAMGELADGVTGGDVVIQIIDNAPSEEADTPDEIARKKRIAEMKARKDANKPPTHDPKEKKQEDVEDAPEDSK